MNIYFYIFTEKVHQYDAQCIMTGGLFSCHQEVKQAHRPEDVYKRQAYKHPWQKHPLPEALLHQPYRCV